MPITLFTERNLGKGGQALPVIAMDTILVVRPRKMNLAYTIDEINGTLKNTGNTFSKLSYTVGVTQLMMKPPCVMCYRGKPGIVVS